MALDDAGRGPLAGELRFDPGDPSGCRGGDIAGDSDTWLALLDMEAVVAECIEGGAVEATHRAAARGARGAIFLSEGDALSGIALGNRPSPPVRAAVIERHHSAQLLELLFGAGADGVSGGLVASLERGRLIADDSYEEHFIFRADEFAATRAVNFLWHRRPTMLRSNEREPLSTQLMRLNLTIPDGWFSRPQPFVPLFNPSLVSMEDEDGSLLATLRMSNGPGCPSVRRSQESSMDTRIFRNALVLAQLNAHDLSVRSQVIVETPPLSCFFRKDTKVSGRQFLDEVHGPMDVRIVKGTTGELWITFYAERNVAEGTEVERGIHAAPLRVEWELCGAAGEGGPGADRWQRLDARRSSGENAGADDGVGAALESDAGCRWLRMGEGASEEACRQSCDSGPPCNAFSFMQGHCVLRKCDGSAPPEPRPAAPGWSAWHRSTGGAAGAGRWRRGGGGAADVACAPLGKRGDGASLAACRVSCEAEAGAACNGVSYSELRLACVLRSCRPAATRDGSSGRGGGGPPNDAFSNLPGWESWLLDAAPSGRCLKRALVEEAEIIAFPAESGVEKNWNLIQAEPDRLIIEYHIEPHIVIQAGLLRRFPPEGASTGGATALATLATAFVSRWPYEVLHGVTNVRGGFCCMEVPAGLVAEQWPAGATAFPDGRLLLGVGHLQRIRTPFDQAPGDLDRFRRQAKSRTYHQFFYMLRGEPPFDVVGVSSEWCITLNGRFSAHWRAVLAEGEDACEAIQFCSGLALRGRREVIVGYGINDCEGDLLVLPLSRIFALLLPADSDVNVSLADLEMI